MFLTNILKSQDYFAEMCVINDGVKDCTARNTLFNDIFTATNVAYSVTTVFVGLLSDRYGMVLSRSVGALASLLGLIMMTLPRVIRYRK